MSISVRVMPLISGFACAGILCAGPACPTAIAQSLQPVVNLPAGEKAVISDMSGDGSTLVAQLGTDVFRYRSGAWQSLGGVAGLSPVAVRASHNGDYIVGTLSTGGFRTEQVHVHRNDAWVGPAQSQPFEANVGAFISADGSRLLTNRNSGDFTQRRVYQWNGTSYAFTAESTAFPSSQDLHVASSPFDEQSWFGMSDDGLNALGTIAGPVGATAVRFGQATQPSFARPANITPGMFFSESSRGNAMSGNGEVIYGIYQWSSAASSPTAGSGLFRWTAATGTTLIAPITSQFGTTEVSADGDFWVLTSGNVYSHTAGGILTPTQLFTANNVDFTSWTNLRINQVSSDGRTFAGTGNFNTGVAIVTDQAWTVTIPTPATLGMVLLAGTRCVRRRR